MKKLCFFLFTLFLVKTFALEIDWQIQVTSPQYDLTHHNLDTKEFKPFMAKTSWRCWAGETQTKIGRESKSLRCNYSSQKSAQVTTFLSCSEEQKYNETVLELLDEKKNLTFKVMLICQVKSSS